MRNATARLIALVSVCLAALAVQAAGQYPDRALTVIAPFAPGGSSDIVARTLAPELSERLGQSVVVENVGGAGGTIGTQKAVHAKPDGYTLLVGSGSEILINKLINPKTPYDALQDLAPVAMIATGPMVLLGRPGLPPKNVKELVALAKSQPKGLTYASAGNGTPMHVAGELFAIRAGIDIVHVPYKGAAPALVDLMANQVDLGVATLSASLPHIRAGKLQVYGVTSEQRSDLAPDLPALSETPELAGFDLGVWFGLFVPARTPPEIVTRLQQEVIATLGDPDVQRKLADSGLQARPAGAAELSRFMRSESEKYRQIVRAARITAE